MKTYASKKFVKAVKKITLKVAEPKKVSYNRGHTELYHNSPQYVVKLNLPAGNPTQGLGDNMRVGDQIYSSGYTVRLLLGQKSDRPNVTFKIWFIKVPQSTTFSYASWFDPVTNNSMLDDINEDLCTVVKTVTYRPNQAALAATGGKEFTFVKKLWIPYRKLIKFAPANAAITTSDPMDLVMIVTAFDAYGTAVTDNIAYVQTVSSLHYRDP